MNSLSLATKGMISGITIVSGPVLYSAILGSINETATNIRRNNTISIPRATTRTIRVTVVDAAGTGIDIVGCSFIFRVVPLSEYPVIMTKTTASSAQIAVTDPTHGIFEIYISNTETDIVEDTYKYGIQMTTPLSNVYNIQQGNFEVEDNFMV